MESNFQGSLLSVCAVLVKHEVEYLVVGGTAVALYGYYRLSITSSGVPAEKPDLDFWYNPTYDNYFNLLNAIEELGEDMSKYKVEKSPKPKESFFKLNFENFTVDFLPTLPGLAAFRTSYRRRCFVEIEGVGISFIDLDDLIANKNATAREKDITDVSELKRIRASE